MSRHLRPIVLGTLLVCLTSLGTLLTCEFVFRLVDYPPSPPIGWRWDRSPYKSDVNQTDLRTNQLGLRGRPIEIGSSDFIIVLVGDSYVEAGAQPFEDMPERILEDQFQRLFPQMRVRVFSVAAAGWSQDQELIWLSRYFEHYRADLVIHWMTPVNDYWENTFVDRSVSTTAGPLKPTFGLKSDGTLVAVDLATSQTKIGMLTRAAWHRLHHVPYSPTDPFAAAWESSLPPSNVKPVEAQACPPALVDQDDLIAAYRAGKTELSVRTPERVLDGRTHYFPFLQPETEREAYAIRLTNALVQRMRTESTLNGAKFLIAYPSGSDIDRAMGTVRCIVSQDKWFSVDARDPLKFLKRTQLSPSLIDVHLPNEKENTLSSRDWHLNRLGNEIMMQQIVHDVIKRWPDLISPH